MDARLRVLTTYKLLNNTRYFRLRLCAGGVVTGVLAGVIISCFRLALTGAASLRANLQSLVQGPKEQILHIQCVLNRPSNGLGTNVAIADVGALPWSPRLAVSTGDVGSDRLFTAAM